MAKSIKGYLASQLDLILLKDLPKNTSPSPSMRLTEEITPMEMRTTIMDASGEVTKL